jgi:hypothetical protein
MCVAFFLLVLAGCQQRPPSAEAIEAHRLSFVPCGMEVNEITYAANERMGLDFIALPGDNEGGLFVYSLPPEVAAAIGEGGLDALRRYSCRVEPSGTWHGRYTDWHETPIAPNWRWESTDIVDYVTRYVSMDVDPEVARAINAAIHVPGSFYAFGRIGVFIVIPARGEAVYAYNG